MTRKLLSVILSGLFLALTTSCRKDSGSDGSVIEPGATANQTLATAKLELAGETFTVELAYTSETRREGLMYRSELPADRGMLFIFAESAQQSFYMKNHLQSMFRGLKGMAHPRKIFQ